MLACPHSLLRAIPPFPKAQLLASTTPIPSPLPIPTTANPTRPHPPSLISLVWGGGPSPILPSPRTPRTTTRKATMLPLHPTAPIGRMRHILPQGAVPMTTTILSPPVRPLLGRKHRGILPTIPLIRLLLSSMEASSASSRARGRMGTWVRVGILCSLWSSYIPSDSPTSYGYDDPFSAPSYGPPSYGHEPYIGARSYGGEPVLPWGPDDGRPDVLIASSQ